MKRVISVFLIVLMIASLTACAGDSQDYTVDIANVKESIISELGIDGAMDLGTDRLLDLYGIEAEDVDSSACFVTMDGVFPDEIIMVNAKSKEAMSRIEEKLRSRLDEVKVQSQSYDPENYAMAQECKVMTKGMTVALFLSPDHEAMEEMFESAPAL